MRPETVRYIRKEVLDLNQGDFARLVGVSRNTVVNWEIGRSGVPDLQAGIIRQLEQEARRRENIDEWAKKLLALAVGGLFLEMLSRLFRQDDET